MSIPPLEKAVMPPKAQEASQILHARQEKEAHAQNQLGAEYSSSLRRNSEQTVRMEKSENNEYRYDAKEKGNGKFSGGRGRKKGKRDEEDEREKEKEKDIRMTQFDMRV